MAGLSHNQRKLLRQLQRRQGRRKSPYFVAEGLRCCREVLDRRPEWVEFVAATGSTRDLLPAATAIVPVPDGEFAELAQTENPQGVLAVVRRPENPAIPACGCVLVLDRLADPGNIGTILRTAWAVGVTTVAWTAGTCDPFGAKAVRAGMGAQLVLALPMIADLTALKHWPDRPIWLTDVRAGTSCFAPEFDPREAFIVLGNEAGGTGDVVGAERVHIPMPGGAESLNVAQAATVLLFESLRRGALG